MRALAFLLLLLLLSGCKQDLKQLSIGKDNNPQKILIAGDTSEFKQQVINKVISKLGQEKYYFKMIGLEDLAKEDTQSFQAIVLLNTFWAGKIDGRVDNYLQNTPEKKKVIVFTSVGDSEVKCDLPVDTITAASKLDQTDQRAEELAALIKQRF